MRLRNRNEKNTYQFDKYLNKILHNFYSLLIISVFRTLYAYIITNYNLSFNSCNLRTKFITFSMIPTDKAIVNLLTNKLYIRKINSSIKNMKFHLRTFLYNKCICCYVNNEEIPSHTYNKCKKNGLKDKLIFNY